MDPDRRYTDEEVARILDVATGVEPGEGRALATGEGMTLAELQEIGREVGIPEARIADAATALDRPLPATTTDRNFLGTRIGVGRTVYFDRRLTDREWERLVVELRETFDAKGKVQEQGSFRQWTNGNLQALLEPTESGERLRLRTLRGDAVATLGVSAGMVVFASVFIVFMALEGLPGAVTAGVFWAALGGILHSLSRVYVTRWADTRQRQMDGVADRLLAAIAEDDG
jgi:hypothetical protein